MLRFLSNLYHFFLGLAMGGVVITFFQFIFSL